MSSDNPLPPLDVLYEDSGLTAEKVPPELRRLYGGNLGFEEPCVYANFVSTLEGAVAIPSLPKSNSLINMESEADLFVVGLLRTFADVVLIGSALTPRRVRVLAGRFRRVEFVIDTGIR